MLYNTEYEILTDDGFKDFVGIVPTNHEYTIQLSFDDGSILESSLEHKYKLDSGDWIEAINIKENMILSNKTVLCVSVLEKESILYDIVESETNTYITNDVTSHNCSFFGTSGTLISGKYLSKMTWDEPDTTTEHFVYYERPKPGHTYIVCVDTSEGVEEDSSVAHVIDITKTPYTQCCMFRDNKTTPIVFTEYIAKLVEEYNDAHILVETNSVGSQVGWYLFTEYEFDNVIMTSSKGQENVITGGFSSGGYDYGLRMTKRSKRVGCSNLKTLIEEDILQIRDYETISELQTFSKKRESYEAEEGKYDDIVMTLVIFAWLTTQNYFVDLVDQRVRDETIEKNIEDIEAEMQPIFIVDGDVELMNNLDDDEVLEDASMFL